MDKELIPVKDVRIKKGANIKDLFEAYKSIHGFTAGYLAVAAEVLSEGLKESDARFLAFTGNLVATGLRGIIAQLIDLGLFNIVITTCGAVDHDIARSLGGVYYRGDFDLDDVELSERGIHRLGNVLIPK
ncbi:MAG: deoxyhypusine synthase family protein, partial [Sulfolobales archaeon]